MNKNLNEYPYSTDEIDLHEIIKILIESKKLIILTILIFTIVSIFYSLSLKPEFKSSSILEVGYFEMPDGTLNLIEKPLDTISSIRTNLIYKKRNNFLLENLIIESPDNKLINLQLTSKSTKTNLDLFSEIHNYIDARHSNLFLFKTNLQKDQLSNKIKLIDSRISFLKDKYSFIQDRINKLTDKITIIELEIMQYDRAHKIFDLEQEQKILKNQLQSLMNQTQVKTRPIGDIETSIIKPKNLKVIFLGLVFGFFSGIFLVIINNFIKSLRKIEA